MQRFKFGLGAAVCIFVAISVFMVSRRQRAKVKKISDVSFIAMPNVYPNGRFEGVILDPVDSNIKIVDGEDMPLILLKFDSRLAGSAKLSQKERPLKNAKMIADLRNFSIRWSAYLFLVHVV